jgi:hypothetical protein
LSSRDGNPYVLNAFTITIAACGVSFGAVFLLVASKESVEDRFLLNKQGFADELDIPTWTM